MTALLAFLETHGLIAQQIMAFWKWMRRMAREDPEAFKEDLGKTFSDLNKAQTLEDHYVSAESIAQLITRTGVRKYTGT